MNGGEKYSLPGICLGIPVLVAPGDLVWESCSEISVALKAEAFSEKRDTKTEIFVQANSALSLLHSTISTQLNKYPEATHIIAGDLNHVDLKVVFPKLHQHVKCVTQGKNLLDKVYSNIKQGYRAIPSPHLGQSDHISLFMLPAYTPLRKRNPPHHKDC